MTAPKIYQTSLRIAKIKKLIENTGLTVTVSTDFLEYRKLRCEFTKERPIYPMFDSAASYVGPTNAFWVALFDNNGELRHTQALRCIDLAGQSLRDHFNSHHMMYVTPGATDTPESAVFLAGMGLNEIRGKVCYKGEFWLSDKYQALRGTGITSLLSRLSFELSYANWNPDFQWALVDARHALGGLHTRYGYKNGAQAQWQDQDGYVFADEWLIWMSNAELGALVETPVETVPEILDAQAIKRGLRVVHDADQKRADT